MKKIILIMFLILSLTFCSASAAEDEDFTSTVDSAGILSEAVERYIYTSNKLLSRETGARIIVATSQETGELTVNEYAKQLYDELGVSYMGRNNSIFIFISYEDKDYCLIVSEGISASLTESYAQKCLVEYMEEDFDKGNYDDAVIKTYNAFADWYQQKYRFELELTEDMTDYDNIVKTERKRRQLRTVLVVFFWVLFVVGGLTAIVRYRRKKRLEKLRRKRQERRKRYMQIKNTGDDPRIPK
ncbi:MAG: TPM domain-containing protein [Clostridia bacterium]|nr:TPM domain-containing protein [Clostridia bacterium]